MDNTHILDWLALGAVPIRHADVEDKDGKTSRRLVSTSINLTILHNHGIDQPTECHRLFVKAGLLRCRGGGKMRHTFSLTPLGSKVRALLQNKALLTAA